jgi:hypothetical protein
MASSFTCTPELAWDVLYAATTFSRPARSEALGLHASGHPEVRCVDV